jgi:hypothetical protein
MIDYGVDYATILDDGTLVLDLSPIRITGPMVPVVRVARAWVAIVAARLEVTLPRAQWAELAAQCHAAALQVDHVVAVENMRASLGGDKAIRVSGDITVGGDREYPLNVSIGNLGAALARIA